jgi:TrmH family RNA methyltransferase
MERSFLDRIIIVLCRPEGSMNIGAVCRAMENMGLSRLALVGDLSCIDDEKVRMMAIHALPIYEEALRCERLEDVTENTVIAAGITRRRGKNRKRVSWLPEEFAERAADMAEGDVALVFGNEQNGLNDEELAACSEACHIPSHPDNPSLNLSHAVQIMAYALYREAAGERVGRCSAVPLERINGLTETVDASLREAGYYDKPDRFRTSQFFRDIFARARLTSREADHLEKVFQRFRIRLGERKE